VGAPVRMTSAVVRSECPRPTNFLEPSLAARVAVHQYRPNTGLPPTLSQVVANLISN